LTMIAGPGELAMNLLRPPQCRLSDFRR
jgi:hypothetical protein